MGANPSVSLLSRKLRKAAPIQVSRLWDLHSVHNLLAGQNAAAALVVPLVAAADKAVACAMVAAAGKAATCAVVDSVLQRA
ncbi:hypothetical protein ON010_g7500 [Phytophthora cinnamomi]|nr:hypothetical protein ON010_g7500 [Phytophthora cinnamomi]